MARARGWWPIAWIVLAVVVANVVSNRVVPKGGYVAWSILASVVLVVLAVRVDGRSWDDLGLGRSTWARGVRWGAVLAGSVLVLYLLVVAVPATRDLFRDERVEGWTLGQSLWAALVRVPFGTVLLEEVAFRGVVPAVLAVRTRTSVAVGASALLFGLWHVLPALGLESVNPVADDTVGQLPAWVTVAASVLSTSVVGVWFWWLRARSGSLLAPMALHGATNSLGYLFAYAVWNG